MDRADRVCRAATRRTRAAAADRALTVTTGLSMAWGVREANEARIVAAARGDSRAQRGGSVPAAALLAGLLTLTVAVVGQSALAGAREVVAHLIEAGLVALALYAADVGRGERQLQLLRRKREIPPRDLVFAHVEIGVAGITRGAGGEGREPDLVRRGRHVIEQVEQHAVCVRGPARGHECLRVAHGQ